MRFAAAPKPAEPEPKRDPVPKRKVRNDPRLVAAARELRDRYLEAYNSGQFALAGEAKYDVTRGQLEGTVPPTPLLTDARAA